MMAFPTSRASVAGRPPKGAGLRFGQQWLDPLPLLLHHIRSGMAFVLGPIDVTDFISRI
jgi:hypothetical protein